MAVFNHVVNNTAADLRFDAWRAHQKLNHNQVVDLFIEVTTM